MRSTCRGGWEASEHLHAVSQSLRTFIAIELPESVRSELQRRQDALARSTPRGSVRWVPVASIHLTLKFLGEVDRARITSCDGGVGGGADRCAVG